MLVKITAWARNVDETGEGVHFWLPPFGTLVLWPDRAGILIGIRLTGAHTKHRDFTGHVQGLSACHSNTAAQKTNPISK